MVYITLLSLNKLTILIHLDRKAEIALLIAKKVKIPKKYLDFSNIFSEKMALILLEITKLNQHTSKLHQFQQPPYEPIYSLGPIKLEILKTSIKINMANSFIQPSKSPIGSFILFV